MRLTGFTAIEYAERAGFTLNKTADRIDDGAEGLSIAEAQAIADGDPESIWLDVVDDEYYGAPRNMEPGEEPMKPPKLAGQRSDELAPGQNSGSRSRDRSAIGSAGGGLAVGGLAGSNSADGQPDERLEDAMGSGNRDHSGDREEEEEPQSGRSGGAVGGTPAGKRVRPK